MRQNKLVSIHILRIVAALSVVLAHLSLSYQIVFGKRDAVWDFFDGNFGVDLFFVISGFIMLYSSKNLYDSPQARLKFLSHRFARIVPLYWLATTLVLLQSWYLGSISYFSWANIIGSYLFLPFPTPQGGPLLIVGWTLNIEMFFYFIFSISVPYKPIFIAIFTTSILLPLSVAGHVFYSERSIFVSGFTNPLMLEFIIGMWLAMLYVYGVRLHYLVCLTLASVAVWVLLIADKGGAQDIKRAIEWGTAFSCLIAAITFIDFDQRSRLWLPIILLGDSTYAIYVLHWFILMTPPKFLIDLVPPLSHPLRYSVITVSMVIIAGIFVHLFIEKPLIRYLRRSILPAAASTIRRMLYPSPALE